MDCLEDGISFSRKHKGMQDLYQNVEENEEEVDEIDPEYEQMRQDMFQDSIVSNIFHNIAKYIDSQAISICEYITREDIEDIINEIA